MSNSISPVATARKTGKTLNIATQGGNRMKQLFIGDKAQLKKELWQLDLEPIIVKMMDKDDGYGWSLEECFNAVEEYRRFIFLVVTRLEPIVPTKSVDKVWHTHILDTAKYREDCQNLFGFFLDHFPYFGMRGEEDQNLLQKSFQDAAGIYKEVFGSSYLVGINGANCGTCGSNACGSCAGSGITEYDTQKSPASCDKCASCWKPNSVINPHVRPRLEM